MICDVTTPDKEELCSDGASTGLPEVIPCTCDPRLNQIQEKTGPMTPEQLCPPRFDLIHQTKGYCGIYALLNSFDTMAEVCQFLNIPAAKEKIEEDDLTFFLGYMEKAGFNIGKDGFGFREISHVVKDKEFWNLVGITKIHFYSKKGMDLHMLLMSNYVEDNHRYFIEGISTSDTTKKTKAVNNIVSRVGTSLPEVDSDDMESIADDDDVADVSGKKRKGSAVVEKKQAKKPKKGGKGTEDYVKKRNPKAVSKRQAKQALATPVNREEMQEGIYVHANHNYHVSSARTGSKHAVLVWFNNHGVPFLYDPGHFVPARLLPHCNYQACTLAEVEEGVTKFVDSLIELLRVYELRIYLQPRV